jgi:hypothetical protein
MIHWDMVQRSDEWRQYKAGKISASEIESILPGKRGSYTAARAHYMDRIAQEQITGEFTETYCSPEMQRGIDLEADALAEFEIETGILLTSAGFIDHSTIDDSGCSPDGLIIEPMKTSGVEVKCMNGANHTAEIIAIEQGKEITSKYYTQIQWSIMCANAKEWYYVLYNPDCKLPELRLYYTIIKRDEKKCAEIEAEVLKFKAELSAYKSELVKLTEKIRSKKCTSLNTL